MDKRYYVKKGPSYRERLRCPLCGKMSPIGYFSQSHLFGIYRFCFAGRGKISCEPIDKGPTFMQFLTDSIVNRLLDLLKKFTGQRYYSQEDLDSILYDQRRLSAKDTLSSVPQTFTKIIPVAIPSKIIPVAVTSVKGNVKPYKVVVE